MITVRSNSVKIYHRDWSTAYRKWNNKKKGHQDPFKKVLAKKQEAKNIHLKKDRMSVCLSDLARVTSTTGAASTTDVVSSQESRFASAADLFGALWGIGGMFLRDRCLACSLGTRFRRRSSRNLKASLWTVRARSLWTCPASLSCSVAFLSIFANAARLASYARQWPAINLTSFGGNGVTWMMVSWHMILAYGITQQVLSVLCWDART